MLLLIVIDGNKLTLNLYIKGGIRRWRDAIISRASIDSHVSPLDFRDVQGVATHRRRYKRCIKKNK